jgi:uncharacterized protein (DUF1800 family)
MDLRSAIAAARFGLGRRPRDGIPGDPLAWLEAQIGPVAPQREVPGLAPPLTGAAAQAGYRQFLIPGDADGDAEQQRAVLRAVQLDAVAWVGHCLLSDAPFQDRLTNLWANHFTISRRVRNAGPFIGPWLREVIRPGLFGRFADLLLGTIRHPGMLIYLSNQGSIGPNSRAGLRTGRGLNENLAREILELHTVTPAAGYTQADVTAFAAILTGWSAARDTETPGFRFRPEAHEPGPKTLLGQRFEEGEEGGIAALRFLAEHPATHRHLATRLARHFVADDPPREAVARLFGVLRDTCGDLGAASRALLHLPGAWSPPLGKLRDPQDYLLALGRALEFPPERAELLASGMAALAQPVWTAPQPVGWPDLAAEWAVPEATLRRVEWAHSLAGRGAARPDGARALAEAVLGPLAHPDTLREAARAGSAQEALTLLLVSPEFQRR